MENATIQFGNMGITVSVGEVQLRFGLSPDTKPSPQQWLQFITELATLIIGFLFPSQGQQKPAK